MSTLYLRGARERNLRNLDLDLELHQWIAVTGVSGSGKSALVFDTLVREGQRRFLGALTPRARQFLGKLGRADVASLSGLPPTLSLGMGSLVGSSRSTVGTRSGVLDILRLWYAREARDPEGHALSRSSFSFNTAGACPACEGLGVEDDVDPALLVADPKKSIRDGALVPTLASGYTVYSQVTLEVMDSLCHAHGFDVSTPWQALTEAQKSMVLYGTNVMKVPFGKHGIESRMKWKGITARPREEGYYRGLIPVIEETLSRSRNPNILRFVRTVSCRTCGGTRLDRPGREATLGPWTLPALLAVPLQQLQSALEDLPQGPVGDAVLPGLSLRTRRCVELQLGHLSLDRSTLTLSGGEAQRLGIATQLIAELGGFLVALDEPTLGLHPTAQSGLARALRGLVEQGNTVVTVEHDPDMVRHADHHLSLGPGAGPEGGRCIHDGPVLANPLGGPPEPPPAPKPWGAELRLTGAVLHNLVGDPLVVPLGRFTVVLGPSGAGKTSLVFQTLLPALRNERGGAFRSLEGCPIGVPVHHVDASPLGRTPRSTPATWSGLFDRVRRLFASTTDARARSWTAGRFSYNNKAGRCSVCDGLGFQRIGLHLLADLERPCALCKGSRYAADTLEVLYLGRSIGEVLNLTAIEASIFFTQIVEIKRVCQAMADLGIGHLKLGQSSTSLSRGEAQRVKLATLLGGLGKPGLVVLDEPDRGLHPADVSRLTAALRSLVHQGHTVLAISHHRHVWAAADHRIGLDQGAVIVEPRIDWKPLSASRPQLARSPGESISLRGVRTHNLCGVDVVFPRGQLTVVVGPSGSGKSSLVFDTLAAEAWRRFSETLPFQVRRFARRLAVPALASATGLGPTLSLGQGAGRAGRRSTVATQSGLGPLLRLWWSRAGTLDGKRHTLSAQHFSPDSPLGACPACEGMGEVTRTSEQRLISDPRRSLLDGAMAGTRPGRFFGEPDGQYMAMLAAAVPADWTTPWQALDGTIRHQALHGTGDKVISVAWQFKRGARTGNHRFEGTWDGLATLVERESRQRARSKAAAEWAEPLVPVPCEVCCGARLAADPARVEVAGRALPAVLAEDLDGLDQWLCSVSGDLDERMRLELHPRVHALQDLGLGHLQLDRRSPTLSDGELQRIHLGSLQGLDLAGLTVVLDEPGAGLHERDLGRLLQRLRALVGAGHTLVVVSHRPAVIRAADHLVELGPGAGAEGGRIVAAGPRMAVLAGDTLTARALRETPLPWRAIKATRSLRFEACSARNLRGFDLALPPRGLVTIVGVSGSGKSTLIHDVVGDTLRAGRAMGCSAAHGFEDLGEVRTVAGFAPTSTPLEHLGLHKALQKGFAAESSLPASAFSFRSPKGWCVACKGAGTQTVSMDYLADLRLPCPSCNGRRFRPEVLEVEWGGHDLNAWLTTPLSELNLPTGKLSRGVEALVSLGLGHLSLGRRRREMSVGEGQRVVLARALFEASSPSVILLDEPGRGQHERDLLGLVERLRALTEAGHLVIAAVHRRSLVRAADYVVELGPGSGPRGGQVVYEGSGVAD